MTMRFDLDPELLARLNAAGVKSSSTIGEGVAHLLDRIELLRDGLDDIYMHFDDQGFPPESKLRSSHEEIIVNFAGAVLRGDARTLADYAEQEYGTPGDTNGP